MIVSFNDKQLELLYKKPINEIGKQQFSKEVITMYRKRLDILAYADNLAGISKIKGLKLEKLKGEYKGCYSIRVNIQYRIIFKEVSGGKIEVLILELSKHYE